MQIEETTIADAFQFRVGRVERCALHPTNQTLKEFNLKAAEKVFRAAYDTLYQETELGLLDDTEFEACNRPKIIELVIYNLGLLHREEGSRQREYEYWKEDA